MHGVQHNRLDAEFIGKEAIGLHAYDLTWTIRNPGNYGTLHMSCSLKNTAGNTINHGGQSFYCSEPAAGLES